MKFEIATLKDTRAFLADLKDKGYNWLSGEEIKPTINAIDLVNDNIHLLAFGEEENFLSVGEDSITLTCKENGKTFTYNSNV